MSILIVGAAAGFIIAYIMVCVAAPVFLARIGELTAWPTIKAGLGALVLAAVLVIYLISESTSPHAAGVWLFLATMVSGTGGILVLGMRKPWLHHTIGVHDETVLSDVLGGDRQPEQI